MVIRKTVITTHTNISLDSRQWNIWPKDSIIITHKTMSWQKSR